MENSTLRKPGEMFTASSLKKANPFAQFIFIAIISLIGILFSKYLFQSDDYIKYIACFGVVFYAVTNPWLCLLTSDNKKYIITSFLLYGAFILFAYGLVYFFTGQYIFNSFEIKLILISITFYFVVAYGMMSVLKFLFLDQSGGGM